MKQKIYGLLIVVLVLCFSSMIITNTTANTKDEATTNTKTTTSDSVQVRTTVHKDKTIKVNKKINVRKLLKLTKAEMKDCTFQSSKSKVARVSKKGIIKGRRQGSATITVKSKSDSTTVYGIIKVKVKNRYSNSDLRLLSSIIYSEAGNQCYAGKKAVGIVVLNRVKDSRFPGSISGVIYQSGQFTPARNGSFSRSLSMYDNGTLNSECIKAAKEVLNGSREVTYNGNNINMKSFLFFSGYVAGCRLQIQDHMFK